MPRGLGKEPHRLFGKVFPHECGAFGIDVEHRDVAPGHVLAGVPDRHFVVLDGEARELLRARFAFGDEIDKGMSGDIEAARDRLDFVPELFSLHRDLPWSSDEGAGVGALVDPTNILPP